MKKLSEINKVLFPYKKGLLLIKKDFLTQKKGLLSHTNKLRQITMVNSHDKQLRQIATVNSHGKQLRQIPTAKRHGKQLRQITITNMCEGVPTMLLLTHFKHILKRSFMFCILIYFKSWNYNTNVLVRIIVPCLNRCELVQNLKFYLLQKEILIWLFWLFCDRGLIG